MIAISIISIVGYIISFIERLINNKFGINLFLAVIVVISWWDISLTFSIVIIPVTFLIILINFIFGLIK